MFSFSLKLEDIANAVGGKFDENEKRRDIVINSFATSPEKSTENDIAFVYSPKYLKGIDKLKAKAVILPTEAKKNIPVDSISIPIIWVERPKLVLKKILIFIQRPKYKPPIGIDKTAVVDPSCKIGENVSIGANVFIGPNTKIDSGTIVSPNVFIGGNVSIGKNCLFYPNCSILDYSQIGNNVIIHAGTVIGSDGYSYVTEEESNLEKAKKGDTNFNFGRQIQHKVPTAGFVIIEDDVEIGANSCVDGGTVGPTIIGTGTKIDNLVQVAHNCKIGKDCLLVGQVGFAGSVTVGDRVVAGGQVGFADNIEIGHDVICLAKSGIHSKISPMNVYMGTPAVPYKDFIKNEMFMKRLPRKQSKLEEQIKLLEEKIKLLEEKLKVNA